MGKEVSKPKRHFTFKQYLIYLSIKKEIELARKTTVQSFTYDEFMNLILS